jgi:hypothetical protein
MIVLRLMMTLCVWRESRGSKLARLTSPALRAFFAMGARI